MMVWLVYPLTQLYRIIRHSGSGIGGFLTVSFYDRRDDGWQLLRSWQLFGRMYTRPKALAAEQPGRPRPQTASGGGFDVRTVNVQ